MYLLKLTTKITDFQFVLRVYIWATAKLNSQYTAAFKCCGYHSNPFCDSSIIILYTVIINQTRMKYFFNNKLSSISLFCPFHIKETKEGMCPSADSLFGICIEECSRDMDCKDEQKCCSNGCGHSCVMPIIKGMSDPFILPVCYFRSVCVCVGV